MKQGAGPRINNLKVHLVLTESGNEKLKTLLPFKCNSKQYSNFGVVKDRHTYIIFSNGFVNITGVKDFTELTEVIPRFCQLFELTRSEIASDVIVDNISAAGNFQRRVDLTQLQRIVNQRKTQHSTFFSVHFDRNFFPGAFCKTRGLGTLTLFPSGKYVVVGSKCLEHVEKIFQQMCVLMPLLSKTGRMKVFAQSAV